MNAQRKIKRQTLFAPGHIYYGQKVSPKGQLISKGLFGIPYSPKKTKNFDLQYYDTSGRLVLLAFLGEN